MSDTFTMTDAPSFEKPLYKDDSVFEAKVVFAKVQDHKYFKEDDKVTPQKEVSFAFQLQGDDFSFQGDDGDFRQERVYGSTSTKFSNSDNCKLSSWVAEILQFEDQIPVGFSLDLKDLLDQPVKVVLQLDSYPDKKKLLADGKTHPTKYINRVKTLLRTGGYVTDRDEAIFEKPVEEVQQSLEYNTPEQNLADLDEPF